MTNSVVSDNAAEYAGGLMGYDYSGPMVASLDEVEVTGNTATYIGGGGWFSADNPGGVSVDCVGSVGSSAGFTGNESMQGGGIYIGGEADLTFDTCDFGTSGNENSPDSIRDRTGAGLVFVDDETFDCDEGVCGTQTTYTLGGIDSSYGFSTFIFGNIVLADSDILIESFSAYISESSGCSADFYLMSNSSPTGSGWTVEWASTGTSVASTPSYVDSEFVGVTTTAGTYYALTAGSTCSAGALGFGYTDGLGSTTDSGFGDVVGFVYSNDYTSTRAVGDSQDFSESGTSGLTFGQEATIREF
jgi:hypothetical protein